MMPKSLKSAFSARNCNFFTANISHISLLKSHLRLGNEAFATRKFDEAIAHYNNAIKYDPSNAVYYSNRR